MVTRRLFSILPVKNQMEFIKARQWSSRQNFNDLISLMDFKPEKLINSLMLFLNYNFVILLTTILKNKWITNVCMK